MLLAATNAEKLHLIKCGFAEEKIKVLSLGFGLPKITRIPSKHNKILFLGRLTITKNIDLLVKAVAICKRKDFDEFKKELVVNQK